MRARKCPFFREAEKARHGDDFPAASVELKGGEAWEAPRAS